METISLITLSIIIVLVVVINYKWFLSIIFVAVGGSFIFSGFGILFALSTVNMIPNYPLTSIIVWWIGHLLLTIITGIIAGFFTSNDLQIFKTEYE